jgi:hypothetical protein
MGNHCECFQSKDGQLRSYKRPKNVIESPPIKKDRKAKSIEAKMRMEDDDEIPVTQKFKQSAIP